MRKNALGTKAGSIELQSILDNIKNIPLDIKDEIVINQGTLKLTLKIPTLRQENILLSKCEQEINTDEDLLKEGIGKLYIYEIIKYVHRIQVDDDVLDMKDVRIHERVKLVERLPLSVYTKLNDFIESVNKYSSDILTVDETEVAINAEFFDTSADD
jgi:hypothetical protein